MKEVKREIVVGSLREEVKKLWGRGSAGEMRFEV